MSNSASSKSQEQAILRICNDVFEAIRRKDAKTLEQFLADDFVQRNHDGSESGKESFLAGIRDMPLDISSVSGEHLRANVYGNLAVLTGVQHAEWRQGEVAHGLSSVAFTDIFSLRDGKWLMVLAYGVELQS